MNFSDSYSKSIYIVATPIGTISDVSERARLILSQVDFIVCEDTRITFKLLNLLGISAHHKLLSLPSHNEKEKSQSIIDKLLQAESEFSCALVTDAGTPAISDPGSYLIELAHLNNIAVFNVPGPSSLVCVLASSGFRAPRSLFVGFLPREVKKQIQEFELWSLISPVIVVFYESPERILKSLKNFVEYFGDTVKISLSREISKKFEETKVGIPSVILQYFLDKERIQGEFCGCIYIEMQHNQKLLQPLSLDETSLLIIKDQESSSLSIKELCKQYANKYGFSAKVLYSNILQLKKF